MNYVGIILKRWDGKILFQLRDNDPNIKNPNCWGLFGGGIEKNETPIDAAIRELNEELGIKANKGQLKFWMTFYSLRKKRYIFNLKLDNDIKLRLKEGTGMGFFTPTQMLFKKRVAKPLRLFLLVYPILNLFKNNKG